VAASAAPAPADVGPAHAPASWLFTSTLTSLWG
jgi:hypothetical protein